MTSVLTICPYKLLPLRGGGALRSFHVLRQLARSCQVNAVIFQREEELRNEADGYRVADQVTIHSPLDRKPPRTPFSRLPARLAPALQYRWLRRSWRGPAEATLIQCHHLLREILTTNAIDVVVFEHLSTMMAAPLVKRLSPRTLRILDAYNVDHLLAPRMAALDGSSAGPSLNRAHRQIEWHEKHLNRSVDAVWTCSEEDRKHLAAYNPIPIDVVPNGVDVSRRPYDDRADKADSTDVLFCGSLTYPPNVDGLHWFTSEIWPRILDRHPDARLTVVGHGGDSRDLQGLRNAPQVNLVGEVPDVTPYYSRAGVFVCPLREGSGTRLKILEAMSMGNPVVSTRIGAEGIEAESGREILLADEPEAFADQVVRLLEQPALFDSVRRRGRALVERVYDWDLIGNRASESIERLLSAK